MGYNGGIFLHCRLVSDYVSNVSRCPNDYMLRGSKLDAQACEVLDKRPKKVKRNSGGTRGQGPEPRDGVRGPGPGDRAWGPGPKALARGRGPVTGPKGLGPGSGTLDEGSRCLQGPKTWGGLFKPKSASHLARTARAGYRNRHPGNTRAAPPAARVTGGPPRYSEILETYTKNKNT